MCDARRSFVRQTRAGTYTTHEELLENELASAGLVLLNGSQDL